MNKYIIGGVAGATSLAVAFPLIAQLASAADSSASAQSRAARAVPTQACVQAMADKDAAFLANIDTMMANQKKLTQARKDALSAAASITDDTQRSAAVEAAQTAFHDAMKALFDAEKEERTAGLEAFKTACGDSMRGFGGHGGPSFGKSMKKDGFMKGGMGGDFSSYQEGHGRGLRSQGGEQQ